MSSTSGFFTLALGHILGLETFSILKLGAVVASILGVSLVTKGDSEAESQNALKAPLLGDALALLSALLYAGYVSLLKLRVGDESRISYVNSSTFSICHLYLRCQYAALLWLCRHHQHILVVAFRRASTLHWH